MVKRRKAGLPDGFKLDIQKPEEAEKPIRLGDYIDEVVHAPAARPETTPAGPEVPRDTAPSDPEPVPSVSAPSTDHFPAPTAEVPEPVAEPDPAPSPGLPTTASKSPQRTRLNVSLEGQVRLEDIWMRMKSFGREKNLRKSEIVEALILALYDAREELDLSNVRRRGKYGSTTHKNLPISLAESIRKAIADYESKD